MKKLLLLALIGASLVGCGNSGEPDEQKAFYEKIERFEKDLDVAEDTNNRVIIDKKELEIKYYLKTNQQKAFDWVGEVSYVGKDKSGAIKVTLEHRNQDYKLIIVDPEAIEYASNFSDGDIVIFTGELGPERSVTISGALDNPEFELTPEKFRLKKDSKDFVQSSSLIDSQKKLKEQAALERRIRDDVAISCKREIRKNLHNPNSADFSFLDMSVFKVSENKWGYRNTLEAKNAFGNVVESKVICYAIIDTSNNTVKIKEMEFNLLD